MKLHNIAILLAGGLVTVYLLFFAFLYFYQRDLLFFGGRFEDMRPELYNSETVRETDGTQLTVWEIPPAGSAPVIVFFYGNAGTLSDFVSAGETLHAEGYGIVLASYRGYSGNRGLPTEDGLMSDARAILATLPVSHPIVLWGQSLGSGIAARMASEGRASALILQSPYTAIVDVAAERFPLYPVRWVMADRFDTLSLVPKIKMPVLIMHGTVDDTVPFDMGQKLAAALGREATFVPLPGRGHNMDTGDVVPIADKWLKGNAARIGR